MEQSFTNQLTFCEEINNGLTTRECGEGWLTKPALEMFLLAVNFAGFVKADLITTIHVLQKGRNAKANLVTVENAMRVLTIIKEG